MISDDIQSVQIIATCKDGRKWDGDTHKEILKPNDNE